MKKYLIAFVVLCGVIAGAVVYLNKQKTAPMVESTPGQPAQSATPEKMVAPKLESPPTISANAGEPAKIPTATPPASEARSDDSATPIRKAVDALLSSKSASEKHELFQQLIRSGQIDQAIAELKQRAADNPDNAQFPTTLGEALLNKLRAIRDAGGDPNDQGILAMQADQSFNAALKIDPQNWEANFVKAASMYYWPADATRDSDVVQRLSSLIDQQETMASQPQFAQTYVVLGNEYQKIGQPDRAQATWQLGLTKFPNDPALQKKINSPPAQ
jgi:tetratricopeptide (TPR) repeat protein